ncbi:MAG: hypothetical protein RSF34_09360 [Flavobacterium sp.]|uniref:MauE/DoxX family redox-associated membrane protein n=1 Tax=Flavobacterium sp. TaxID=239 RepID=UPI002FCBE15F
MRNILSISKKAVTYFFIILFIYAAVSKLADFENFRVQVAQSPLLSAYATFIAYTTVIGELVIALMLCFQKTKRLGLYLFLGMMSAFTVYIYLILNYSPFVPCSCGGILEKMGWTEHLWFNIVITLLATAMVLDNNLNKRTILLITGTLLVSSAIVVLLFISSEHIMKTENPFTRRFLPHPVTDPKGVILPFNSYYIAGATDEHIYLGNHTAPLHGLKLNSNADITDTLLLQMDHLKNHSLTTAKWNITNDSLILHDSNLGLFYSGSLQDRVIQKIINLPPNSYSSAVPLTTGKIVLRLFNSKKNNVTLGILNTKSGTIITKEGLLDEEGQPQDLFSNDGILLYSNHLNKVIYVYYYKNKSLVLEQDLSHREVLKTIDTISRPNFTIAYLEQKKQLKMSEKPVFVNKAAATSGNYLFILSERMGRNERRQMYSEADIIDVYDLRDLTYSHSFYLHRFNKTSVTELSAHGEYLFGIGDKTFTVSKFRKSVYE